MYAAKILAILENNPELFAKARRGEITLIDLTGEIRARIRSTSLGRKFLLQEASALYEDFHSGHNAVPPPRRGATSEPSGVGRFGQAAITAIMVAALILIASFVYSDDRIKLLSELKYSRGFITYIFAVGAISLFLVIPASIMFDKGASSRERYERSKTVFGLMLGLFGTILGFYYGTTDEVSRITESIVLRELQFGEDADPSDGKFSVKTSVNGGKEPYVFTIEVLDKDGNVITGTGGLFQEANGVLSETIDLTARMDQPEQNYTVEVTVRDLDRQRAGPATLSVSLGKSRPVTKVLGQVSSFAGSKSRHPAPYSGLNQVHAQGMAHSQGRSSP